MIERSQKTLEGCLTIAKEFLPKLKTFVYDCFYMPYGKRATLEVTYYPHNAHIHSCKWVKDGDIETVPRITHVEKLLFESLGFRWRDRIGMQVRHTVIFHFIWGGKDITKDKTLPEGNLDEFFYLYAVETVNQDGGESKFLALKKWQDCRYIKDDVRVYNGQDVNLIPIKLESISSQLLNDIAKTNKLSSLAKVKGSGNGSLFIPQHPFLFQRPESWLYL